MSANYPAKKVEVLYASGTTTNMLGTTYSDGAYHVFVDILLPAGLIQLGDVLDIEAHIQGHDGAFGNLTANAAGRVQLFDGTNTVNLLDLTSGGIGSRRSAHGFRKLSINSLTAGTIWFNDASFIKIPASTSPILSVLDWTVDMHLRVLGNLSSVADVFSLHELVVKRTTQDVRYSI